MILYMKPTVHSYRKETPPKMRYIFTGSVNILGKYFYTLFLTADSFKLCIVS
jgi:hypothetical protein